MREAVDADGQPAPQPSVDRTLPFAPHLAAISSFAIELAAALPDADLVPLITDRLRTLTGAVAVTFSEYDEARGELALANIATDGLLVDMVRQLTGGSLLGMRMPVPPDVHGALLATPVTHVPDITTLTLGTIPPMIGSAIARLLRVGEIFVLGFKRDGRLFGTSAVLVRAGVPPVPPDILTVFSNLAATSLLRRRAERALMASEARFRAIVDAVNEAIIVCDEQHRTIVEANQTALAMFGYSLDELREATGERIAQGSGEWGPERLRAALERAAAGEPQVLEWRCATRSGTAFWAEVDLRRAKLGDVDRIVMLVRDISPRKDAEVERARLEEQFRQAQKMESIGRLAGGVAHDFNNLLTAIMGNLALATEDLPGTFPARERLEEASRAAESAAALTRQLLAFSRKQLIEPRVVQLNGLVHGVERLLKRLIGEHIELGTLTDPEAWPVRIDPGQFEQVVVNLAVNARDAMPDGGRLTVSTGNRVIEAAECVERPWLAPGRYVSLTVSDTGRGMSDEVKAHLFEPFFTTKERGRGTGLGLAMVYGAVKQHGGAIEVDSVPGQGTTFRILLPALPDETAAGVSPRQAGMEAKGGTETILLVEDDPAVRNLAGRVLQRLGYGVIACADAGEAVRAASARAGRLELLLTDLVMPGMNGRVLAEKLREIWPGMKVLLTSGYSEDLAGRGIAADAGVHFIPKPYSTEALARKVREVLDATAQPPETGPRSTGSAA